MSKRAWMVLGGLLALCSLGASVAQTEPFRAVYERRPSGSDFAKNYPHAAASRGTPGIVALCCSVNRQRNLDCSVAAEWPQDQGFGEASLRVAKRFRVDGGTAAHYAALPGERIRQTLNWTIEPVPDAYADDFRAASARILAETDICRAPRPTS